MRGYVHVYTGDGKGKTTAAIGLAVRAAGAGLKVYIAQFIKMGDYSEIKSLKRFSDLITIEQYGLGRFIGSTPSKRDIAIARKGLEMAKNVMASLMDHDWARGSVQNSSGGFNASFIHEFFGRGTNGNIHSLYHPTLSQNGEASSKSSITKKP